MHYLHCLEKARQAGIELVEDLGLLMSPEDKKALELKPLERLNPHDRRRLLDTLGYMRERDAELRKGEDELQRQRSGKPRGRTAAQKARAAGDRAETAARKGRQGQKPAKGRQAA